MTQVCGVLPPPLLVTEGETVYLSIDWTDREGAPATPTAVEFGCYDARTGAVLLAGATVPGPYSSTTEIVIPPAGTACQPGVTAMREVAVDISAQFGSATEQKTMRQVLYVQPLHLL